MLVLIQHNYVNCYLKEEPPTLRGPGPSYTLYEAALPRILQSLRWAGQPGAAGASPAQQDAMEGAVLLSHCECNDSNRHPATAELLCTGWCRCDAGCPGS